MFEANVVRQLIFLEQLCEVDVQIEHFTLPLTSEPETELHCLIHASSDTLKS